MENNANTQIEEALATMEIPVSKRTDLSQSISLIDLGNEDASAVRIASIIHHSGQPGRMDVIPKWDRSLEFTTTDGWDEALDRIDTLIFEAFC